MNIDLMNLNYYHNYNSPLTFSFPFQKIILFLSIHPFALGEYFFLKGV